MREYSISLIVNRALNQLSTYIHTYIHTYSRYKEQYIASSLIIHEENTKEIETEFEYVMKHLHKIKPTFISIFSLNTDLFEMLYQTLGRVFHQVIQIPRSC